MKKFFSIVTVLIGISSISINVFANNDDIDIDKKFISTLEKVEPLTENDEYAQKWGN